MTEYKDYSIVKTSRPDGFNQCLDSRKIECFIQDDPIPPLG